MFFNSNNKIHITMNRNTLSDLFLLKELISHWNQWCEFVSSTCDLKKLWLLFSVWALK